MAKRWACGGRDCPPALAGGVAPGYSCGMAVIDLDPGFDTLAYAQTLKAAGVEDKQAQAHAEATRDSRAGLATGADLDARLASLEARLIRALWVQGAGLVAVMTALMAAFKLFG